MSAAMEKVTRAFSFALDDAGQLVSWELALDNMGQMGIEDLSKIRAEADRLIAAKQAETQPVVVRVTPPEVGDRRYKRWARLVTRVDRSKDTGYAFVGDWCPKRDFEAKAGALVLAYGEEGSAKYHEPVAHLYAVDPAERDGLRLVETAEGRSWALNLRDTAAELLSKG